MNAPDRNGLTLIELLAALGMLAFLLAASLSWTTHATRLHREASDRSIRRNAVEATLRLIQDDLNCGDFEPRTNQARVLVAEDILVIRTRDRGEVIHRYEWSATTKNLHRIQVRHGEANSQLLLNDVASFEAETNFEERWLEVRLGDTRGGVRSRRYLL